MEQKITTCALFRFLAAALLFSGTASPFGANFTNNYNTATPFWLSTDVSITPAISITDTTYCTNEPIAPTVSVSSIWFTSQYATDLPSNANNANLCLYPYSIPANSVQVEWIDSAQLNSMNSVPGRFFTNNEDFSNFLLTNGISPSTPLEPSTYRASIGGAYPGTYKAKAGVYARGRLKLVSSNPAHSYTIAENYLGAAPAITPFSQSTPGTFTLASSIELIGLLSTAETVLNEETCSQSNARIYSAISPTLPQTYSSVPITIIVENPFVCQLSSQSGTYAPVPVNQSGLLSFSFSLSNGGALQLRIPSASNISLAPGSPFSNLSISTPFPIIIPPNGGSTTISGTVRAPATVGNYSLNLRVSSQTTVPDCSGSIVLCPANSLFIVNVTVAPPPPPPPQPVLCSLQFVGHGPVFLPGESSLVRASCTQGASSVNCPAFNWYQNAQGGSLSYSSTSGGALHPQNTLSISSSAFYPQPGMLVNATNGTVKCNLSFDVDSPSISLNCGFLNHGEIFFPGETALFRANCTIAGVPNGICPILNWTTSINSANMVPNQTQNGTSPRSSTFTTTSSTPAPQNGSVVVKCANPALCAPCRVSASILPYPNHLACHLIGHGSIFAPNDSSQVQGSCSFSNSSTACPPLFWFTNITGGSLTPHNTLAGVLPNTTFTTLNAPVGQHGTINATSTLPGFTALYCDPAINASVDNLGVDYIVYQLHLSKTTLQVGESLSIDVVVKNTGNQNASNSTITAITSDCSGQVSIPLLNAGANITSTFSCVCNTVGLNTVNATANRDFTQFELNYANNNAIAPFQCGAAFAPMCIDYI